MIRGGEEEGRGHKHGTLSHEGLAGVQEDFTPFDDHPLYRQVFADVFGLAHFVVHYPEGVRRENGSW